MASDERSPQDRGAEKPRNSGAPRSKQSSYKGGSRSDGSSRGAGGSSGGYRKDGGRTGSSSYKGGPRKDGDKRSNAPRGDRIDRPQRAPRVARDGREASPAKKGPAAPEIPEEVVYGQLDRTVRARLRTLSKENAEDVGRHLIMAGNLLDTDPELAYRHAAVAASRGGRVDVVREAAAVTAYATGRYAEALREFRTVRRLNGSSEHLPLMADCERGLGRPERAIALAQEPEAQSLTAAGKVELAIVVAGARGDMGQHEAALVSLKRLTTTDADLRSRIDEATAEVLRALGRDEEAAAIEPSPQPEPVDEEDVIVYDTFEDIAPEETQ